MGVPAEHVDLLAGLASLVTELAQARFLAVAIMGLEVASGQVPHSVPLTSADTHTATIVWVGAGSVPRPTRT